MQITDKRLYSICRCCGFTSEEEFYFYSHYGCGDYIICPCCGKQSGYNDFDAESILKRQEAVEICKNIHDQYLD